MKISPNIKYILAGLLAGCVNGLLGAGGGLVLVPLFIYWCRIDDKKALATSVAIIFGLSVVSSFVYLREGVPDNLLACIIGGAAGGIAAGTLMKKVPVIWLRRVFALLLLYSSYRMIFT